MSTQDERLLDFYKDWRGALDQLQAAQAAVTHWEVEAKLKEARFKGAAELANGTTDVSFEYDESADALTFTKQGSEAPVPE